MFIKSHSSLFNNDRTYHGPRLRRVQRHGYRDVRQDGGADDGRDQAHRERVLQGVPERQEVRRDKRALARAGDLPAAGQQVHVQAHVRQAGGAQEDLLRAAGARRNPVRELDRPLGPEVLQHRQGEAREEGVTVITVLVHFWIFL